MTRHPYRLPLGLSRFGTSDSTGEVSFSVEGVYSFTLYLIYRYSLSKLQAALPRGKQPLAGLGWRLFFCVFAYADSKTERVTPPSDEQIV